MENKEVAWENIKLFLFGKEFDIKDMVFHTSKKNIGLLKKEYNRAYKKAAKQDTTHNDDK